MKGCRHDQPRNEQRRAIEQRVEKILAANRSTSLTVTNRAADTSALEREIDALVYKLYGLAEEEIKIVGGKPN